LRQEQQPLEVAADEIVSGGFVDRAERRGEKPRRVVYQPVEAAEMRHHASARLMQLPDDRLAPRLAAPVTNTVLPIKIRSRENRGNSRLLP
jgi:hypothetical protein